MDPIALGSLERQESNGQTIDRCQGRCPRA